MLTIIHPDGRTWQAPDELAAFATMTGPELAALTKIARAQVRLESDRSSLPVIRHSFPCRHRREAAQRDEVAPDCRWASDSAGGYSCVQCGTWAQPDSERARVLDSRATQEPLTAIGPGHGGRTNLISRDAILVLANERAESTGERRGQALFNVLATVLPDLAEKIRGTNADPFYADHFREPDDERVARAISAIDEYLATSGAAANTSSDGFPPNSTPSQRLAASVGPLDFGPPGWGDGAVLSLRAVFFDLAASAGMGGLASTHAYDCTSNSTRCIATLENRGQFWGLFVTRHGHAFIATGDIP